MRHLSVVVSGIISSMFAFKHSIFLYICISDGRIDNKLNKRLQIIVIILKPNNCRKLGIIIRN